MNDFGLYALGQFTLSNSSDALIGVRYDNRSISSGSSSSDYSNFNGSLGLKKEFSNSTLRFNLSTGFRSPNLKRFHKIDHFELCIKQRYSY